MAENTKLHPITIDLNQFKLHIALRNRIELTLHFNSPSRRFYLSVIAFVVNEMKRHGKITSIPLEGHHDLLALMNETIGGAAGSSEIETLMSRIYMKWQHALPNLEEAPLFTVLGKKKGYEEGISKTYHFTEAEKDSWANLFEYKGSHEHVRLKFAIDKIGASLNDIIIIYEDSLNADAWERFISSLQEKKAEPDRPVSGEVKVSVPPLKRRKALLAGRYRWAMLVVMIVLIAALVIWKLYTPYAPEPGVVPKEKITASQPEKAPDALLPSVKVVSKEKITPPSPEKISKRVTPPLPKEEVASKEKMAFPLPDLPSIAVLPFANISEDPGQEFLSYGITEEITTALSKIPRIFVISRQSTFSYKGKPVKVKQVSEELGVQYVLEGSIQRSADRIRINAQLIDALTGRHIWAERYNRELTDLFALQDEITMKILRAIQVNLTEGDLTLKFTEKPSLECYLKFWEGLINTMKVSISRPPRWLGGSQRRRLRCARSIQWLMSSWVL
jgi:TolB-like protein